MLQKLLLLSTIAFTSASFAQDIEPQKTEIPFSVIENVPIYPGCEGNNNEDLKKCMSDKITEYIMLHFNMKKIYSLELTPKIYRNAVQFKIDKNGEVVDVKASADHPEIEAEAVRVISSLPKMKPGIQRGQEVGVVYAIPIIFEIEPPKRKRNKKFKKTN